MIGLVTAIRPGYVQRRLALSFGLRVIASLPVGRKRDDDSRSMTEPRPS